MSQEEVSPNVWFTIRGRSAYSEHLYYKTKIEMYNPTQVTLSIVSTKYLSEGRLEFSVSDSAELQMEDVVLKDPKRQKC